MAPIVPDFDLLRRLSAYIPHKSVSHTSFGNLELRYLRSQSPITCSVFEKLIFAFVRLIEKKTKHTVHVMTLVGYSGFAGRLLASATYITGACTGSWLHLGVRLQKRMGHLRSHRRLIHRT